VLLGSDYPFDMGMPDGVLQVRGLPIGATEQASILGEKAQALLGAVAAKTSRAQSLSDPTASERT